MLSLPVVKGGKGKDVAQSIPVPVNGHKDWLAFAGLHLQDQVAEGSPVIGSTEDGRI